MRFLTSPCEFLSPSDTPSPCDLIFVLAGRDERKPYGLELFRQHLASRLILSVGRFEVRQTAQSLHHPELLRLRDETPPGQRHFWMDFTRDGVQISRANLQQTNTFWELHGLGEYVGTEVQSIAIVSTSIHLRRIRFCCSRIPFFRERRVIFVPVPEEMSSFQKKGWWKRPDHWFYVTAEYVKLAAYHLLHRNS